MSYVFGICCCFIKLTVIMKIHSKLCVLITSLCFSNNKEYPVIQSLGILRVPMLKCAIFVGTHSRAFRGKNCFLERKDRVSACGRGYFRGCGLISCFPRAMELKSSPSNLELLAFELRPFWQSKINTEI